MKKVCDTFSYFTTIYLWCIVSISMIHFQGYAAPYTLQADESALDALYSSTLKMNAQGQPRMSVRVSDHQQRVLIESKSPITAYLGADRRFLVRGPKGKSKWDLSIKQSKAGRVSYWVIAEIIRDVDKLAAREAFWRDQGHKLKLIQTGAHMVTRKPKSESSQVHFRKHLILLGNFEQQEQAQDLAVQLTQIDGFTHRIMQLPKQRPQGVIAAKYGRKKKSSVESHDAIWFSSASKFRITTWEPKNRRSKRVVKKVANYKGDIYVVFGQDGSLVVVNVLPIENIVQGVVPAEQYFSAPMATLQAQAVAARGHMLAKLGLRHRADPYMFCSKTHCQGYKGIDQQRSRTTRAAYTTRGWVAVDPAMQLIDTVYSSTCGGHTEAYHLMWGGKPQSSLMGVVDNALHSGLDVSESRVEAFVKRPPASYCQKPKRTFRWTAKRKGKDVTQAVKNYKDVGAVHKIEVSKRGVSGRALNVLYTGEKGSVTIRGEYVNRKVLGRLRSGLWLVSRKGGNENQEPDLWIFEGGGYGHGVGMCQHGAIGMAKAGADYKNILAHYYHGMQLKKLW